MTEELVDLTEHMNQILAEENALLDALDLPAAGVCWPASAKRFRALQAALVSRPCCHVRRTQRGGRETARKPSAPGGSWRANRAAIERGLALQMRLMQTIAQAVPRARAREIEGGYKPDQYSNPANPRAHYETTGPELWRQTDGRLTHFVAGVGTGGTISGVGRYLKEVSGGAVRVIGADPVGSVYSGGTGRPYLVEGVGEDIWPATFDREVCDEIIAVERRRLLRDDPPPRPRGGAPRRRLVRHGGRGRDRGRPARRARRRRRRPPARLGPWLPVQGVQRRVARALRLRASPTGLSVGDVLEEKSSRLPSFLHTHPNETVRDAIDILREYEVSQPRS